MTNKIHFPGLNGLRFIAAFLVLVHHNERIKLRLGLENFWESQFIIVVGKLGVILFFVLSGFLITYLLLKEEKKTGSIHVKQFYIRRILRIWPLYFLIMGLFCPA
ncbi:MAG: acyltransferase [Bacteroidetes bacterium]|nr:acyltransferase [Bacteroidota bacterium]